MVGKANTSHHRKNTSLASPNASHDDSVGLNRSGAKLAGERVVLDQAHEIEIANYPNSGSSKTKASHMDTERRVCDVCAIGIGTIGHELRELDSWL